MLKVLQLKTSILDAHNSQGVSSQLSDELLDRLREQHAGLEVTLRDFSQAPVGNTKRVSQISYAPSCGYSLVFWV